MSEREPGWYWVCMHGKWRPVEWAPTDDGGACGWWSDDGAVYAEEWWAGAVTEIDERRIERLRQSAGKAEPPPGWTGEGEA